MRKATFRDRLFQSWWRLTRGLTLGVRVVAVTDDGRIGLVRHTYVPGWHLPGGGVEHGETAYDAALRELLEETGARARGPLKLHSVHANHTFFPNDHVLVFLAQVGDPGPKAADLEIAEVVWVKLNALPDGVTPATQARLTEVLTGAPADPNWST